MGRVMTDEVLEEFLDMVEAQADVNLRRDGGILPVAFIQIDGVFEIVGFPGDFRRTRSFLRQVFEGYARKGAR